VGSLGYLSAVEHDEIFSFLSVESRRTAPFLLLKSNEQNEERTLFLSELNGQKCKVKKINGI